MNTRTLTKTLFQLFFSIIVLPSFAVPANQEPVERTQPDGTVITYRIKGDERINWIESLDGYRLMYNKDRAIVFATKDAEDNMVPSKILYKGTDITKYAPSEKSVIEKLDKKIFYNKAQIETLMSFWKISDNATKAINITPVEGTKKALCVLAAFSDKSFTKTQEEFDNLINQIGYNVNGATGSVRDYYLENSYGKLTLEVTVFGPVLLNNTASYYADNSRYSAFAREAAQKADAGGINFAEFANDNGQVGNFHIIFAGYGDESINDGKQIWSHKSQFQTLTLDGVKLSVYSCSPEFSGSTGTNITRIGVICHELCHVFGAPDYYDTDYEESGGNYGGTGEWDLMASGSWGNGGTTPAHINGFQKMLYGWINPVPLTDAAKIADMGYISSDNPTVYTIDVDGDGEMYLLENRQRVKFDSYVPGNGLIIYHAHRNAATMNFSNDKHPMSVYPVCASSTTAIPTATVSSYGNISSSGCAFPGSSSNTEFSDKSTPMMFSWTTGGSIDKPVTNITNNTSTRLISFDFKGGIYRPEKPNRFRAIERIDTSITLSWESNSTVVLAFDSNDVIADELRDSIPMTTDSVLPGGATIIYTGDANEFTHFPLKDGKVYHYKIWAYDSSRYSAGVKLRTTTIPAFCASGISEFPYNEDFESGGFGACWTGLTTCETNDNPLGVYPVTDDIPIKNTHSGENFWLFSIDHETDCSTMELTNDQYAISPVLHSDKYKKVSFYYRSKNTTTTEKFNVGYSATNSDLESFTWSQYNTNVKNTQWKEYQNYFPAETKYIAISFISTFGTGHYIAIDDLSIDTVSELPSSLEDLKRDNATNGLSIYPNPADDIITVTNLNGKIKNANIYDMRGNLIYNRSFLIPRDVLQINSSDFADGVYVLKIGQQSAKFIIRK
ncbi:MAG: M6 family metalloprotease domain-containing protein [Bacteroidales bacterium]|jgi:M6 family metalloprotease-like protein|nr:M6 family metalloprotease domain-containing protein [Bacteroidales bacterium]